MKKITNILALGVMCYFYTSCSVSGPLMVSNHEVGPKTGVAKRKIFLNITFGHTDLGAITAAKKGGINKVGSVDWKVEGGLFSKTYSTVVTGE